VENKYAFHLLEQLIIKSGQHRHHEALQTLKAAVLAQQPITQQGSESLREISARIFKMSNLICSDGYVHVAPAVLREWSQGIQTC